MACDLFCVDTILLRRLYVLFFLEVGSRRLRIAGATTNPAGAWIAQQARNLDSGGAFTGIRFLIRDRDTKYTHVFDAILESEGVRVIRTPVRTPVANAYAERVVGTIRRDCLDWLLIYGRRHLERVLRTYAEHYNAHRPAVAGPIERRDLIAGSSTSTSASQRDGRGNGTPHARHTAPSTSAPASSRGARGVPDHLRAMSPERGTPALAGP